MTLEPVCTRPRVEMLASLAFAPDRPRSYASIKPTPVVSPTPLTIAVDAPGVEPAVRIADSKSFVGAIELSMISWRLLASRQLLLKAISSPEELKICSCGSASAPATGQRRTYGTEEHALRLAAGDDKAAD